MATSPQTSFIQDFNQFMGTRHQRLMTPYFTPEYRTALQDAAAKESAFLEKIPESLHAEFREVWDEFSHLHAVSNDMYYRLGLGDGLRLANQVLHFQTTEGGGEE